MHNYFVPIAVQAKLAVEVAVQVDEFRSKESQILTADGQYLVQVMLSTATYC